MKRGQWERALRDPERRPASLSGTDLGVAFALATFADNDGTDARPSELTLAEASGRSRSTVQTSLASLEAAKVIVGKRVSRREPVVWTLTEWPYDRATDTGGELTDTRATHTDEKPDTEATQLTDTRSTELTDPQPSGPTDEPSGPIDGPEWPDTRAQQVVDRSFRQINPLAADTAVTSQVQVDGHTLPMPTKSSDDLTSRILEWANAEGLTEDKPPRDPAGRADVALQTIGMVVGDGPDATKSAQQVCVELVQHVTGELAPGPLWGHLGRLVKLEDPQEVAKALTTALRNGAGLTAEHAIDPLALTKYAKAVLNGSRNAA